VVGRSFSFVQGGGGGGGGGCVAGGAITFGVLRSLGGAVARRVVEWGGVRKSTAICYSGQWGRVAWGWVEQGAGRGMSGRVVWDFIESALTFCGGGGGGLKGWPWGRGGAG